MIVSPATALAGIVTVPATRSAGAGRMICTACAPKLASSAVFNSIGQIVLARFLLDAEKLASDKATPAHSQSRPGLVSAYGDLVVLVNPAIEATRIVPFFDALNEYTTKRSDLLSPAQPPRLIILSSEGDQATRKAFPIARAFSTIFESYKSRRVRTPYGTNIELRERQLDLRAFVQGVDQVEIDPLQARLDGALTSRLVG